MITLCEKPMDVKLKAIILQVCKPSANLDSSESDLQRFDIREENELQFQFQHDYIRLNELPSVLQNRSGDFTQGRIRDAIEILGLNVYYLFSDNKVLSVTDIFFHPYCNLVNPELLPVVRGVYDNSVELKEFYWTSPSISFPLKYGDIEYVLLKILIFKLFYLLL